MLSINEETGLPRFHVSATTCEGVVSVEARPDGLAFHYYSYGKTLSETVVPWSVLEAAKAGAAVGPNGSAPDGNT